MTIKVDIYVSSQRGEHIRVCGVVKTMTNMLGGWISKEEFARSSAHTCTVLSKYIHKTIDAL